MQKREVLELPSLFNVFGYKIYFWSNENGEPIHVHVCKGTPTKNATKVWITSSGGALVCHNKSRIPDKDLQKLLLFIICNKIIIANNWINYFGSISYYC